MYTSCSFIHIAHWIQSAAYLAHWHCGPVFLTSCVRARFPDSLDSIVSTLNSNFVGSRVYACLGVTRHLHFWQNDRGLLRATTVTRGWKGHRIRVSTGSLFWRRKFSRRSCRNSNSQPFDHESGARPTEALRPHLSKTCAENWQVISHCLIKSILLNPPCFWPALAFTYFNRK